MRKCISCGATVKLKGILWDDSDVGFGNHAICKPCYFETCSCEMDEHSVQDCLQDYNCENNKLTTGLYHHWDDYDYHFKLKKTLKEEGKVK